MRSDDLFEKVLEMCGFSSVLGPGILKRALADQDATPDTATTDDYRAALPRLQARMQAYLPEKEAASRARRIAGMLAHADGQIETEDEAEWSRFGRSVQILQEVRRRLAESSEIPLGSTPPPASEDDETEKASG